MSRIAYVNGRYGPQAKARVHIEDRGYQFADGVYEVIAVYGGKLIDAKPHLARLHRSLAALRIAAPMSDKALTHIVREVIRRNRLTEGIVYLQVTRGVARRDHRFPTAAVPAVVVTARPGLWQSNAYSTAGVAVVTQPDIRWGRPDIKSVALLPNVLAKQAAVEAGAYEAWLVDASQHVTEGSSTNAWILTHEGVLQTRADDLSILNGITRTVLLRLADEEGIRVIERPFTVADALAAKEAFLSSSTSFLLPVVSIDGQPIGDGTPGPVARRLRAFYIEHLTEAGQ